MGQGFGVHYHLDNIRIGQQRQQQLKGFFSLHSLVYQGFLEGNTTEEPFSCKLHGLVIQHQGNPPFLAAPQDGLIKGHLLHRNGTGLRLRLRFGCRIFALNAL